MEAIAEKVQISEYDSYKDSGVEWLGKVPAHWDIRRIKYLLREINERSLDGSEDLLSVSQYTGVTKKSENVEEGDLLTNASSLGGYKKVYEDDLVSNIMLAWNGSLGFSPFNGITSPAYSVYRLIGEGVPKYFHYLFRTELYKSEFKRNSSGVIESRLRLYTDDFFRLLALVPPFPEQTRIASFLDKKTAQIDQAIAQKERLIELLKERRQIMIHRAVTRGLNPDVKMKDSGVEWIGEIPEHWEVKKLSNIARVDSGATPDRSKPSFWNGTIPWVKTGEVNYKDIFDTEEHISFSGLRNSSTKIAPIGTLLMAMYGQGVTRGRVSLLARPSAYNQACAAIIFSKQVTPRFGYYFFTAAYSYIRDDGNETSQMNISTGYISSLKIPVPGVDEQEDICFHIQEQSHMFDKAVEFQFSQIEKLKEFKSTLINSAVTGKIKV